MTNTIECYKPKFDSKVYYHIDERKYGDRVKGP